MIEDFIGKTVLITGGASGIGKKTAFCFSKHGANVIFADYNEELGKQTEIDLKNAGAQVEFIKCDVTKEKEIDALFDFIKNKSDRLDFAFNNAGVASNAGKLTHEYPADEFKRIIDINITGVWNCMKREIEIMLEQGGGAIVNAASILGLVGMPTAISYVASKHAVIGMTKTAALEYATKGIRVNAVCPGYIDTPMLEKNDIKEGTRIYERLRKMHAMRRLGKAEEIAQAVLFLCSDKSSFMTGQELVIDGGFTAG